MVVGVGRLVVWGLESCNGDGEDSSEGWDGCGGGLGGS